MLLGVAALVVVLVVAVAVLVTRQSGGAVSQPSVPPSGAGSSADPPSSSAPASPSSKGGASVGTIDHPVDGSTAASADGVRLDGSLTDDRTSTYWLVDRDQEGTYTADVPVDREGEGRWSALDQPLGDADELPTQITILLVQADDGCAGRLRRAADADDSTLERLGKGCAVVDTVTVTVDRP